VQRAHDHYFLGTVNPEGRTAGNGFSAVINLSVGYGPSREATVEALLELVRPV
jgi:hypothetical protein